MRSAMKLGRPGASNQSRVVTQDVTGGNESDTVGRVSSRIGRGAGSTEASKQRRLRYCSKEAAGKFSMSRPVSSQSILNHHQRK